MFSYIKGTLEEVTEGQIVVDCHGIGYQIQTSNDILDVLPSIGADLKFILTCMSKTTESLYSAFRRRKTLRFSVCCFVSTGSDRKERLEFFRLCQPTNCGLPF